jgi:hypothetical protein
MRIAIKRILVLFSATLPLLLFACEPTFGALRSSMGNQKCEQDANERGLQEYREVEDSPEQETAKCPVAPLIHDSSPQQFKSYYEGWVNSANYKFRGKPDTLWSNAIFKTLKGGATFRIWSFDHKGNMLCLSAYNEKREITGIYSRNVYVSPKDKDLSSKIMSDAVIEVQGDHAVFAMSWFSEYQHILLDHLGYIAYMRKNLPAHTRILLLKKEGSAMYPDIMETLDPEFSKRITWIECSSVYECQKKVNVSDGNLTVL